MVSKQKIDVIFVLHGQIFVFKTVLCKTLLVLAKTRISMEILQEIFK